ncbi:LysR family transcriptional regulator [Pseudoalteromonas sp. OOF1S-7]|uniref:LysR family transcriptional regulator n=1 Tax=Pseudoalteromonas sp. OOF1S-7 TaxID=2917757 RepID=UPI001EF4B45D|nr:LysR family transcriptional regulator [Pseudoalteromonas sp. OOF1S-7]MCG7535541.1 LysR family transcriptional regulator [Pseudoalteromonas sp. OOF1S-7]
MNKLPNLDLNLLKLFAALYQNGSVTHSAEQLNLSQSACSHALTRLRERLGDELFVRVNNRMLATAHAHRLAQTVLPALQMLERGLQEASPFNASDSHTLTIAATDYTAWCLRPFVTYLVGMFENLNIRFVQLEERIAEQALEDGSLDLVCGFAHQQEFSEGLAQLSWFEDAYVTARCQSHPCKQKLKLSTFVAYPHILIAPWNERRGIVDKALAKLKKSRVITVTTPHVLVAPTLLPESNMLLTMPRRYALQVCDRLNLQLQSPPLSVPDYQLKLYWHRTRKSDPKIGWFITQFCDFHQLKCDENQLVKK